MILEASLRGSAGRQRGWISSTLDLSEQRRMEEISRQQQYRLQANARLVTVGETASLLSHEPNQLLLAIAALVTGSLNTMANLNKSDPDEPKCIAAMCQAISRIAEEAGRTGRVIKSVHDFVRRRESARDAVKVDTLIASIQRSSRRRHASAEPASKSTSPCHPAGRL